MMKSMICMCLVVAASLNVFAAGEADDAKALRVCYDLSGAKRPTEFKTITGTQLLLVVYNRKK